MLIKIFIRTDYFDDALAWHIEEGTTVRDILPELPDRYRLNGQNDCFASILYPFCTLYISYPWLGEPEHPQVTEFLKRVIHYNRGAF